MCPTLVIATVAGSGAGTAEASEHLVPRAAAPGAAPDNENNRSSLLMATAIIATIPSATPPRKPPESGALRLLLLHCLRPLQPPHTILPTAREPPGPAFWGRRRVAPRTPGASGFLCGKPTSCAYHPISWAGRNRWSSMTGMARSPATKWLSCPNYPTHPNLLLGCFPAYPATMGSNLGTSQIFRMARMIPLEPLVGMAGIDGLDS